MTRSSWIAGAVLSVFVGGVALAEPVEPQGTGTAELGAKKDVPKDTGAAADVSKSKEVTGTVKGIEGKKIYIEYNGVVLPIYVTHDTSLLGSTTRMTQRLESRLEKEFQPGDKVNISYELKKMDNYALSITKQ